jgi:hypothetical protein
MTSIFFGRVHEFSNKFGFGSDNIERNRLDKFIKLKICNDWIGKEQNIKENINDTEIYEDLEDKKYFILIKVDVDKCKNELNYECLAYVKISKYRTSKYSFIELCSRLTDYEDEDNLLKLISRYHDKYKTKLLPGYMHYDDNNIEFWYGYIKHQINNEDISLKQFMINNKLNQYVTQWKDIFSEEQYLT